MPRKVGGFLISNASESQKTQGIKRLMKNIRVWLSSSTLAGSVSSCRQGQRAVQGRKGTRKLMSIESKQKYNLVLLPSQSLYYLASFLFQFLERLFKRLGFGMMGIYSQERNGAGLESLSAH